MSSNTRQIQSATIIFCVFQLVCLVIGGLSYGMLAYRVRHFDYGKLRIDEEKILEIIGKSTRNFLYDTMTNTTDVSSVHVPETDIVTKNGVVWETLRRSAARIDGIDFGVGDYYKYGTNIYEIFVLDTDRQRMYAVAGNGDKLVVCCRTGFTKEEEPPSQPAAASERLAARKQSADGEGG